MIVVIADDISGAAELAGVAFERGFTAEVQTRFDPASDAEVVALDTDSRLLAPEEAAARVGAIAREVADSGPTLIYKKTDSVLRGAIIPEIDAITEAAGMRRALLVPANPSRRRIIRGGEYFVDGVALAETTFANDPTHPAWTSNALELLGPSKRGGTSSVRAADAMFVSGVTIPDVESVEDLKRRAAEVDEGVLPAAIHDIKGAIRFLRAKRKDYGFNAEKIAIAGASAGGHLVALVGTTNGHKALEGEIGGNLDQSSDVQAILSYYGASNFMTILDQSTSHGLSVRVPALELFIGGRPEDVPDLAKLASPVFHVDRNDPPLLLIHGDQDPQMPINQSHELHGKYKELGLTVQFEVVHGAAHGGKAFHDARRVKLVNRFLDEWVR